MAFNLSAAFDTVAAEQLSPTLQALGVTGRKLWWFLCYMTGDRQSVIWDGMVSSLINVLYGVRQGSILRPLLFIILVSSMAKFLGVEEGENVVYADDSNVWQTGNNVEEVVRKLTEKVALFVEYTRSMSLSMNAAKTQLLLSTHAGNVSEVTVEVEGNTILPGNVIKLLGVRYDRKLTTIPHVKSLLTAVRQWASVVARLANHLPRGGVPSAAVLRACHGQVCPCTGGCGKAKAGARGKRVRHLEQDPGGLQSCGQEHHRHRAARPHYH
jgi:hypothetical protein